MDKNLKEEILKNIDLIKSDKEISYLINEYQTLKNLLNSEKYIEFRKKIEENKGKDQYFVLLSEYNNDLNVKNFNKVKLELKEKMNEIKSLIESEIKL